MKHILLLGLLWSISLDTFGQTVKKNAPISIVAKSLQKWTYFEHIDKMTDEKFYFADLASHNYLRFEPPHELVWPRLSIIKTPSKNYIGIDLGEHHELFHGEGQLRIRFDKKPPLTMTYSSYPKDGTYFHNIFINDVENILITELRAAKNTLIELEFFIKNETKEILEFNTDGLIWNH